MAGLGPPRRRLQTLDLQAPGGSEGIAPIRKMIHQGGRCGIGLDHPHQRGTLGANSTRNKSTDYS